MDSRILTALQHYPIKDGTNRYCFTKVVYPQNAFACSLLVEDDNLSQQKESTDDDAIIEGECFVYIAGRQIFTIELKQPEFVHQQMCIDMSKEQSQLVCLTAFPLPTHLQQHHKILPIATAILIIQIKDAIQSARLFFDNAEEIEFKDCDEFLNRRIIWINSRYISNKYILLIVGYNNCSVSVFYLGFEETVQIVHVQTFEFDQLILFNDIAYWNDYYVALVSFDGQIEILHICIEDDQIEGMKIQRYTHIIGRTTSQPKFYQQDQELRLMIPIQKGQLLVYENIEKCQLQQYKLMKCPNSNNSLTTGFDIQKKRESPFTESEEYELCFLHFDGTLEIYEMIENALQIEILKQMNFTRYFISNMQLQFKQFLLLASDDDIDIYQMSIYQIN